MPVNSTFDQNAENADSASAPQIATKDRSRRGFILLLHSIMIFFTLGMVGLAVDAGTMYVIKGRLSSAADAAALAAGRSVNLANTVSAATTAAQTTATQFFNANFPNGFLGTGTMNLSTPTFTQETDANGNPNGYLDIAVSASVPAPTYFMQLFGMTTVTVSGTGTASRRSTVMILVLDTSTSMQTNPDSNGLTACQEMVKGARSFITNFSPYDTVGAINFGATANLLYAPSTSFGDGTLDSALAGLVPCGSSTNTTSALYLAYEAIKHVGLPLAYNSIVLFTDGSPNGMSANYPVYLSANVDTRYGPDATNTCTSDKDHLCTAPKMPAMCTAGTTVTGTITQGDGQKTSGNVSGLNDPIGSSSPIFSGLSASSLPAGCGSAGPKQFIAYIPDTDVYGNSTHGVPATSGLGTLNTVQTVSPGCYGVDASGRTTTTTCNTRDYWVFPAYNLCASPTGTAVTPCAVEAATANQQWGGGPWATATVTSGGANNGTRTNFFTTGPNSVHFRPDQPTTIVATSMNTAMEQAYFIRADASGCPGPGALASNGTLCTTKYHPVINTIYLTGNLTDAVDREFLPIMSNAQQITALPYDDLNTFVNYANPSYVATQESGLYQATYDPTQLDPLFRRLASEVLRLSK